MRAWWPVVLTLVAASGCGEGGAPAPEPVASAQARADSPEERPSGEPATADPAPVRERSMPRVHADPRPCRESMDEAWRSAVRTLMEDRTRAVLRELAAVNCPSIDPRLLTAAGEAASTESHAARRAILYGAAQQVLGPCALSPDAPPPELLCRCLAHETDTDWLLRHDLGTGTAFYAYAVWSELRDAGVYRSHLDGLPFLLLEVNKGGMYDERNASE